MYVLCYCISFANVIVSHNVNSPQIQNNAYIASCHQLPIVPRVIEFADAFAVPTVSLCHVIIVK